VHKTSNFVHFHGGGVGSEKIGCNRISCRWEIKLLFVWEFAGERAQSLALCKIT